MCLFTAGKWCRISRHPQCADHTHRAHPLQVCLRLEAGRRASHGHVLGKGHHPRRQAVHWRRGHERFCNRLRRLRIRYQRLGEEMDCDSSLPRMLFLVGQHQRSPHANRGDDPAQEDGNEPPPHVGQGAAKVADVFPRDAHCKTGLHGDNFSALAFGRRRAKLQKANLQCRVIRLHYISVDDDPPLTEA